MNDKENIITTKIQGMDFTYNKDTHYEKDGHIYCKACNERIDGEVISASTLIGMNRIKKNYHRKRPVRFRLLKITTRENIYSYHIRRCKGIFRALKLKEVSKYIKDKN